MKIVLYGPPIPKMRHKLSTRGNRSFMYDPQDVQKKKVKDALVLEIQRRLNHKDREIAMEASNLASDASFKVDLTFYIPLSESLAAGQKNANLWHLKKHNKKPDLDNLEKFILDCANGILFSDDSMIHSLSSKKYYSSTPRTEITIMSEKEKSLTKSEKIVCLFNPDEIMKMSCILNDFKEIVDSENTDLEAVALFLTQLAEFANKLKKIEKIT